jgi:methylmalonyl-CoA mutase
MTDPAPDASGTDDAVQVPPEPEPVEGLRLAAPEDDEHDRAEWEAAVAAVLRTSRQLAEEDPDHRVWEVLSRTTLDGITVPPVGTPEDAERGLTAPGRPTRVGGWDVRTPLVGEDAAVVNAEALVDLDNGGTSLLLRLGSGTDPAAVLAGVPLDRVPVVLDRPDRAGAEALADLLDAYDGTPHPATNLGLDPLGELLRGVGTTPSGSDTDLADAVAVAGRAARAGVLGVVVDGSALHDLGADDAQELGWVTAAGAAYLRALTEAGLAVAEAAGLLEFRLAATDEQFPTIAKLRAARRLWSRVLELSGVGDDVPQRQHAVTSRPMTSRYDPWVNMLRGTVAAFAAGVGGADAVTVLPFDEPLGRPDAFGRRIARNTSTLLVAESHLGRVADPAGGAYAVERLTEDLAVAGWEELGRIEESGGAVAASTDGSLATRVREVAVARDRAVATRARPLTGLSEFPNLDETVPERDPDPLAVPVRRWGAAFEGMRDDPLADHVLLATMGPVARHTARATFAGNLLAAGGIDVDVAGASTGPDDLVAACAGHRVACLAGSDGDYAEWGAAAAEALRGAGVEHVVLAGRPGERTVPPDLVDDHCAVGVDALAFLSRTRLALRREDDLAEEVSR